jgi:hypothetical protein
VLYVAFRAEEQLYVISNMNLSRKGEVPKKQYVLFINYLMNKGVFDANKLHYEFGSKIIE